MDNSQQIVQKFWNYCNVLRDDGMSYGDYPSAEFILSVAEGLRTACLCACPRGHAGGDTQTGLWAVDVLKMVRRTQASKRRYKPLDSQFHPIPR